MVSGAQDVDMRTCDRVNHVDFKQLPGPGKSDIIAIDRQLVCDSVAGAYWNAKLQVI